MVDLRLRISFEDLLKLIAQLPPEQKRLVRQHMDEEWAERFEQALDAIHADIPDNISETEFEADIAQAIRDVRSGQ